MFLDEYYDALALFLQGRSSIQMPALSLSFVHKHAALDWDWYRLSLYTPWPLVLQYSDLPWSRLSSRKPGFCWDYVWNERIHSSAWDWIDLSQHVPWTYVQQYAHRPWHWPILTAYNPYITWRVILQHPEYPWAWQAAWCREDFSMRLVFEYPHHPWNWSHISGKVTLQDVLTRPDLPWDWLVLTFNTNIQISDMLHHAHLPWDVSAYRSRMYSFAQQCALPFMQEMRCQARDLYVACRPLLIKQDPSFVKRLDHDIHFIHRNDDVCDAISRHPSIHWDFVKTHPTLAWSWKGLSMNCRITWDIIEQYIHCPWDWRLLSWKPDITFDIISQHVDRPWCWSELSRHRNVRLDHIQSTLHDHRFRWDWMAVSLNPNITWEDISKSIGLPWDFYSLALRKHDRYVPEHLVETFYVALKEKRVSLANAERLLLMMPQMSESDILCVLSAYPSPVRLLNIHRHLSISWKTVRDNPGLDWQGQYYHHDTQLIAHHLGRYLAATRIQRTWKHVIANPDMLICKNRLHREFHALTQHTDST